MEQYMKAIRVTPLPDGGRTMEGEVLQ